MNPEPNKAARGGWFLMLFGAVFAGVGIVTWSWAGSTVLTWQRMSHWEAVPATLLELKLEEHHGDDSTTYETVASYRYRYGGAEHVGSRVAIAGGADNIGDFQERLYRQLSTVRERGGEITAYVDPRDPSQATLNRDLRGLLLAFQVGFGLVFGAVGVAVLIGGRLGAKRLAAEQALKTQFADEPWRWRPEWASGRIRGSTRAKAYFAIGFAALWNLISAPAAFFGARALAAGNLAALVALLFPVVGIGLAVWAVRASWQWRRYKVPTLLLAHTPVPLGGRLQGTIRVEAGVPVEREFRLELCCSERRQRSSAGKRETSERLLWQREVRIPRNQCQIGTTFTSIPVDVAVPSDQPATAPTGDTSTIGWYLDVSGECRGPDFWSRFELPVFETDESRAAAQAPPATAQPGTSPDRGRLALLGIDYATLPGGGERWIFKRARHAAVAAGLTLFAVVWTVIAAVLFKTDAPIVIPLGFAAFDLVFVWWALSLWFTEYRVTLDRGVLTLARRGVVNGKPVEIPLQWITGIRAKRGMQAGNKLYYDLRVETHERTYTAASELENYDVATWLATYWSTAGRRAA